MKKISAFFVYIYCLLQAVSLLASDNFLDTCLRIAEARDAKLAVAAEQVKLSDTRVFRSGRAFFPMVEASTKYDRGKTLSLAADGTEAGDQAYESDEMGVRGSMPIYEGGRLSASYNYDKLMRESSKFNYTKIREDLFYTIKTTYYEYQSLRVENMALKKAFAEIDELGKKVRVEYNAKAISELDMIEAENYRDKLYNMYLDSEDNLQLSAKKLAVLVRVESLDEIPAVLPEWLIDNIPEITFTLKECLDFIPLNNIDLRLNQLQILMAQEKLSINRSKVIPKIDLEGFYGKSGEAFVDEPLDLATTWSVVGKLTWTLWGNTLEVSNTQDHTNPNETLEPTARTDDNTLEMKLGIIDDVGYFVDTQEGKVGIKQAESEYNESLSKLNVSLNKAYNEYASSLRNQRTLKDEIALKERKLALMRKRNELLEVPTSQLMEESWKYAETISQYGKALYTNYSSVAEMERIVFISLR